MSTGTLGNPWGRLLNIFTPDITRLDQGLQFSTVLSWIVVNIRESGCNGGLETGCIRFLAHWVSTGVSNHHPILCFKHFT